jgi:hypothetical protein
MGAERKHERIKSPAGAGMRALWMFIVASLAAGGLGSSLAARATENAPQFPAQLVIQVTPGDWGSAHASDIEAVLRSAAEVLSAYFPQRPWNRIQVAFSADGPRVLLDRSSAGSHIVLLNVQDTRWAQFSYQFAHELCHIFANYEQRINGAEMDIRAHQWFEESLCEMVSILTLNGMASRWEESPPFENWRGYAPAFRQYTQNLLAEEHRQLQPDRTIADWLEEHEADLEDNPYLRDGNELVATQLLALTDAPGAIEALGYLNLDRTLSGTSLADYLNSWRASTPAGKRGFIDRVMALFAIRAREGRVVAKLPDSIR